MDKFNLTIWLIGMLITRTYLYGFIYPRYGILSSISASAKKLKEDGMQKAFAAYIIFLTLPWALVGYDLPSVIAASLLLLIMSATGYNDNIKNDKMENGIHVGAVLLAISVGCLWCIYVNTVYIFLVVGTIAVSVIMNAKKTNHHTWWIEEMFTYMVYLVMFIEKVLI